MKKTQHWFKFYYRDWLDSERVLRMSLAAQGLYIRALSYQAKQGSLPSDTGEIRTVLMVPNASDEVLSEVLEHFETSEDGRLVNNKLNCLLDEYKGLCDRNKENRAKRKSNGGSTTVATTVERPLKSGNNDRAYTRAPARSVSVSVSLNKDIEDSFNSLWRLYPNRKDKQAARKAWAKLNPSDEMSRRIISHVEARAKTDKAWLKDGGQFVPMLSTFLNNARWEDEYEGDTIAPEGTAEYRDEEDWL